LPAKQNGKFARALKQSVEYATDLPVFLFCMAALLPPSLVYLFFIEKDVNHLFDVRGVALTTTNKK
jgi:hypothetical protein